MSRQWQLVCWFIVYVIQRARNRPIVENRQSEYRRRSRLSGDFIIGCRAKAITRKAPLAVLVVACRYIQLYSYLPVLSSNKTRIVTMATRHQKKMKPVYGTGIIDKASTTYTRVVFNFTVGAQRCSPSADLYYSRSRSLMMNYYRPLLPLLRTTPERGDPREVTYLDQLISNLLPPSINRVCRCEPLCFPMFVGACVIHISVSEELRT